MIQREVKKKQFSIENVCENYYTEKYSVIIYNFIIIFHFWNKIKLSYQEKYFIKNLSSLETLYLHFNLKLLEFKEKFTLKS